jgi:predicted Holliday junction resolvase-like endonuclease
MEILLGFLLCVAAFAILVLLVIIAKERKRANTAEEYFSEKFDVAMLRASEQLRQQEKELRADAIRKSTAVVKGKVAEQLVPFQADFGFNPRDARFLGSPIDLLVFAGLTEGELDKVVFIEVKTGKSRLSRRERQLRDVIDAGEVYYEVLRL